MDAERLMRAYIHILETELHRARETILWAREDLNNSRSMWMQDCAYCGRPTVFGIGKTGLIKGVNDFTCIISECENMYCRECIDVVADFRIDLQTLHVDGLCHIHKN